VEDTIHEVIIVLGDAPAVILPALIVNILLEDPLGDLAVHLLIQVVIDPEVALHDHLVEDILRVVAHIHLARALTPLQGLVDLGYQQEIVRLYPAMMADIHPEEGVALDQARLQVMVVLQADPVKRTPSVIALQLIRIDREVKNRHRGHQLKDHALPAQFAGH
jgi:hypothetical protein